MSRVRSRWIFKLRLVRTFIQPTQIKAIDFEFFATDKKYFQKMAKIPRGELQDAPLMVKR
jgi:hypothetical protein